MRSGLLRSLSGLLSAGAFAIGVASPVQFCPCPTHGAALPTHAEQAHAHGTADMAMPAADDATQPPASHAGHAGHGDKNSPHAAHQCTCPGGCCATSPMALAGAALRITPAWSVARRVVIAAPATIDLAESPQLSLPMANAPPAVRQTPRRAAQQTT